MEFFGATFLITPPSTPVSFSSFLFEKLFLWFALFHNPGPVSLYKKVLRKGVSGDEE